eukprot:3618273-Prymnesium_polylepis.1
MNLPGPASHPFRILPIPDDHTGPQARANYSGFGWSEMDPRCFCRRCAPPPSRTARTARTARATQHARVACGEPSSCKDEDAYTHVAAQAPMLRSSSSSTSRT